MKHYLLEIEDTNRELWDKFTKEYKPRRLGPNIREAILTLIKNELKDKHVKKQE